ncbi:MAG: tetratricopeptide repeat protein [Acidobacteria bacterium]|nr:tetratricopeptide repeat protein [Acidobacteriota bacterium]
MKTSTSGQAAAIFAIFFLGLFAVAAKAQNSISGIVFDESRKPVAKIDVELLDEFERLLKTAKTASSGLYLFQGLRAGVYFVQVRTDGTNYKTAKERIQLGQSNRTSPTTGLSSGSESAQINFTLETDRRQSAPLKNAVVFAQNVPPEAEKLYAGALKKLDDKKPDEARTDLESALKIFPEYYAALERLGYETLGAGDFAAAENYFARALQVAPQSFAAKSGLGIARYKLGRKTEAAATLEEAVALDAAAPQAFLFLGKIYRELKDYERAEKNLKKAAELSKNKLADVHWELALLYYYNLDRPAAAADELELYLKANPKAENRAQVEKLIKAMREKANK